jgi:hypothetical protein
VFLTLLSQNVLDGSRVPPVSMLVTASTRSVNILYFSTSLSYKVGQSYIFLSVRH